MKISSLSTGGKAGFVLSIISLVLIVIFITAAFALYGQKSREIVSPTFTCFSESTNQTFTMTAEVNVADGMDETEAKMLACGVFDQTVSAGNILVSETVLSVNQIAEAWKITVKRTYTSGWSVFGTQHGYAPIVQQIIRTLQATINPNNQTIQYTISG